jgi:dihydroxyacetone kinase phosphoprotein-dependent L subunit
MSATLSDVERAVRVIAETVVANETYFGDLDAVVGDGDFGYSMARGFEIVLSDWEGFDRSDITTFLKKVAVTITSRIGGTSGPIWGTGFLRAATVAAGEESLDADRIVAMLRAATEGIKARGGAELGDKTLLDALVPATDAIEEGTKAGSSGSDTLRAAAVSARSAAEATRSMLAKKGRAAYTGERSVGTLDAGAVAVAVLIEALADQWQPPTQPDDREAVE